MLRKKLPIGIQTFREIQEDDCDSVGKIAFALRMIREGKAYFLFRPRRFAKSLFLDNHHNFSWWPRSTAARNE
ncbi:MAG: AAA family ATPase [Azoarcus sp.]|jgi:hypothetical protein|nr:AAA family ATPase [Azoarcus sp.]